MGEDWSGLDGNGSARIGKARKLWRASALYNTTKNTISHKRLKILIVEDGNGKARFGVAWTHMAWKGPGRHRKA